jgi:hypothetical protein
MAGKLFACLGAAYLDWTRSQLSNVLFAVKDLDVDRPGQIWALGSRRSPAGMSELLRGGWDR